MTWELFLSQILVGGVTAVIASWFAVQFAIKRFVTEKWWERKVEAYTAILEALHHMKRVFDEDLKAFKNGRDVAVDRKEKLDDRYEKAHDELLKRIDIGQFILSDNAVASLSAFQKDFQEAGGSCPGDFFLYLDESLGAMDRVLKQMCAIAKTDLKGQQSF